MASKQSDALKTMYATWLSAMGANPTMSLEETRELFDHWGDVTGEPGGMDYREIEANIAAAGGHHAAIAVV